MPSYKLGDETIRYTVRRGRSRRNIYVTVNGDLDFEVVLPKKSNADPERILREKEAWVRKKTAELSHLRAARECGKILYLGRACGVEAELCPSHKPMVAFSDGKIVVRAASAEEAEDAVRRWLVREARSYLAESVPRMSAALGVKHSRLFLRDSRSRWGSCSRRKNLNFNWRIICLPEHLAEYLVAHELAHIRELNHSPRFWEAVSYVIAEPKRIDRELRKYLPGMNVVPEL